MAAALFFYSFPVSAFNDYPQDIDKTPFIDPLSRQWPQSLGRTPRQLWGPPVFDLEWGEILERHPAMFPLLQQQLPLDSAHTAKKKSSSLSKSIHPATELDPDLPLRISACESGYRWDAKNRSSTASGVFQYLAGTWANTAAGRQGITVFDADANIRMAITYIATKGTSPWNASRPCWSKTT